MAIATAAAIGIATAAAAAGGSVVAAKLNSNAQQSAAKTNAEAQVKATDLTTTAANHAADLQSADAGKALAYQQQQSALARADAESARRANYDQWASAQGRLGSLGQMVGLGSRDIPPYVPLGDGGPGPAASQPGPMASGPGQASVPGGDYKTWFDSLVAGKPVNQQTLLELEPTLNAAGVQLTPPNAAGERTKINIPGQGWTRVGFGEGKWVWNPQGGATTATASTKQPYLAAAFSGSPAAAPAYMPTTGNLTPPKVLSLADYLKGASNGV